MRIALLPVGTVDREAIEAAAERLGFPGVDLEVLPPAAIPEGSFAPERAQYEAGAFVALAETFDADKVVAVTDVDLFAPGLNFVFGQATTGGRGAVVSLHRLHDRDRRRVVDRLVKEIRHELGHTMGLRHCEESTCVMFFSNSLVDTDRKGAAFCGRCQGLLPYRGDYRHLPR